MVDSPGDNLLAKFPSALDATRCAVEIQRVLKTRNADLPADRRMEFRIGIHLGDVMMEGERIYGDGVNIAARLEGIADPGGICISATVQEQVRNKLDLGYDDLGEQELKNIPELVRVYRVLSYPSAAAHRVAKAKGISVKIFHNAASALVIIIVLCVSLVAIWNYVLRTKIPPEQVVTAEKEATSAEKTSVSLLDKAFLNLIGRHRHIFGDFRKRTILRHEYYLIEPLNWIRIMLRL